MVSSWEMARPLANDAESRSPSATLHAMSEERPAARSGVRRILGRPLTHLIAALLVFGLAQAFVVKLFMVPSSSMAQTLHVGDRVVVERLPYTLPFVAHTPENGELIAFATEDRLWSGTTSPEPDSIADRLRNGAKWVFGDVIGIGPTTGHLLVKRVVGTPGQTVTCCSDSGGLLVDGSPLDEPYVFADPTFQPGETDCASIPRSKRCFPPVTVPDGMLLVLGDHRSSSSDSMTRCRGSSAPSSQGCVRWVRADDVIGQVVLVVWPPRHFGVPASK